MKVAVSVPDPIFEAADRLAKQRNVPRSRIFTEALEAYLEGRHPEAVTSRLNEIYREHDSALEPGLHEAQVDSLRHEAW